MLQPKREPKVRINERILYNTPEVRAVGPNGEQLGILATSIAIQRAREHGLDLVEVAPGVKPPVCRILDFGKYKYEESKKQKAAKQKQHIIKVKEIKFHPKTDINDYSYRLEHGKEFLSKGFKIKATVVFRGREMAHMEYGGRWLKQMEEDLKSIAVADSPIKTEGRNMSVTFSPTKAATKSASKPTQPQGASNAQNENT